MKFKAMGANRTTGARMTLEFEAESKGAAERKAHQAGMEVHRVIDVTDGDMTNPPMTDVGTGGRRTGMHPVLKLVLLLIVVAIAYFVVWPMVRGRR